MYLDSHCHLSLMDDLEACVEACRSHNIQAFFFGGTDSSDWEKQSRIKEQLATEFTVYTSFGLHPWYIQESTYKSELERLNDDIAKADACGELGLDFATDQLKEKKQLQTEAFKRQLDIAHENRKPLVLHIVKAHQPAINILRDMTIPCGGIVHGFTGSPELMEEYLKLGLKIGIGPNILNSKKLQSAASRLSLTQFCIESDSPQRSTNGQSNPSAILSVAECLGTILSRDASTILEQSRKNTEILLGIA
ncbi:MAG: TatD family hydrolase [Pseudobacteriovorax sp.]|nr:TatD family hydrolase [Pseudobacteriovorax sp.]